MKDEAETLSKAADRIDYDVLSQITELFCSVKKNGKKVIVAGCGTAGQAGKRIAHTLSVVEIPAFFLSPADSIHGGMGAMQQGDILVLISKSGNTQEILNYLPAAKKSTRKTDEKKKLTFKEQKEFEELDAEIPKLEAEKADIEAAMSSGSLNTEELLAKSERVSQLIKELDEKSMRWLELSEYL